MKTFLAGLAFGVIAAFGFYLVSEARSEDDPVRFPKFFMGVYPDWVRFEGSLYGEGGEADRPMDNFYKVTCDRDTMSCELISINQVGRNHLGTFEEASIPIVKWTDTTILASSKPLLEGTDGCNYYTITMDLMDKTATYERWPREEAGESCGQFFEERVMRWRFDNGRAWSDNADGSKRKSA